MNAQEIAKQVLKRAFDLLDHYGLGPDAFADVQAETTNLTEILLDANSTPEAKKAARRALQAIPIRIKENAVAAQVDIAERFKLIGELLVKVVLGIADLKFGG